MPFADKWLSNYNHFPEQLELICLSGRYRKNTQTVKRWIGKCLHQCNLEIENRDWTK